MISSLVEKARITKAKRDCPTPIFEAEELIKKAHNKWGEKLCVSWSGGRCSTCILYMAIQQDPDIKVIWNNTGVHFPETLDFVKKIRDKWNINLIETKPEISFWKCVDRFGFPMIRGKYYNRKEISKEGKPMCCIYLKETPLKKAMLKNRVYATLSGIRVCESRMRMFGVAQWGQFYYATTLKMWRYHPIAFWDTDKLLEYIDKQDIPSSEVYNMGHTRSGCWPCTGYLSWREQLGKSHPKMYEELNKMVKKSEGEPTLWEYEDLKGCRQGAVVL